MKKIFTIILLLIISNSLILNNVNAGGVDMYNLDTSKLTPEQKQEVEDTIKQLDQINKSFQDYNDKIQADKTKSTAELLFEKADSFAKSKTSAKNVTAIESKINSATKTWTIYKKNQLVVKVLKILKYKDPNTYKNFWAYTYIVTVLIKTPTGGVMKGGILDYDKSTQDLFTEVYSFLK